MSSGRALWNLWIADVGTRDARALVRWWSGHPCGWPPRLYLYRAIQDGTTVLKHGRRARLWNIYRTVRDS